MGFWLRRFGRRDYDCLSLLFILTFPQLLQFLNGIDE